MDVIGWLAACNRPVRTAIAEQDMYPIARLSTLGELETGVTTLVDFAGFFPPPVAREYVRAVADSGLRFHFGFTHPPAVVDEVRRLKYELVDPHPRGTFQVTAGAGMSELATTTAMARLARELDVKLNIHVLENIAQRAEEHVPALALADALGPTLLINHAIHLNDDEIQQLAAYDVRISHNPLSNMRLASGIQRLPELHDAGLKVGLGLDGGTNDTCDMFATMRAAVGLQRAKWLRADVYPTVTDVLRMATMGGAEALDQADLIGSLTPGKKADLIVLDPGRVNFAPRWVGSVRSSSTPSQRTSSTSSSTARCARRLARSSAPRRTTPSPRPRPPRTACASRSRAEPAARRRLASRAYSSPWLVGRPWTAAVPAHDGRRRGRSRSGPGPPSHRPRGVTPGYCRRRSTWSPAGRPR
jgi:5-methylthioadenosine/S-adenosylhomocysteine deaminase